MRQIVVSGLMVTLLVGCWDSTPTATEAPKSAPVAASGRTYANLSSNDVIVSVNGVGLTKGELEQQIAFRVALARMRSNKFDERAAARLAHDMRLSSDKQFIMQELLKGYAVTNGLDVTEADRESMRNRLVKTYARGGSYSQIVKKLSMEDRALLKKNVDRELWAQKGREKLLADNVKPVEDREITERRDYFVRYNERAKEVLAQTWQDASNVWKKATGGYPIEKLVEPYENGEIEHATGEVEWGDLKASDFRDDPELYRVLTTTPKGCIPPPFEGDNGVLVVKMLEVTPADPAENRPETLYRLAKIRFDLPEIWNVETDDELRADIVKIHQREAFAKGLEALVLGAKVEYPCGTELFPAQSKKKTNAEPIPAEAINRLPRDLKF